MEFLSFHRCIFCRKYSDYTQPYTVPTSYAHYDPLPPPPPFPSGEVVASHASHSPAHWTTGPPTDPGHAPHPALSHSMTSYYSHPAFLPHAARDLREAQAGMQVCSL